MKFKVPDGTGTDIANDERNLLTRQLGDRQMHAAENKILDFLRRPVQFTLSPGLGVYGWGAVSSSDIWEDLWRGRFRESVIYVEKHVGLTHDPTPRLQILLGYRFLLLLSTFIAALGKAIDAYGGIETCSGKLTARKLGSFYLFNEGEDGLLRYKILPDDEIRDSFIWLLEEKSLSKVTSRFMSRDFSFFLDKLKEHDKSGLHLIWAHLCKMTFFEVCLEDSSHLHHTLHRLGCVGRELDNCLSSPQLPQKQPPTMDTNESQPSPPA